MLVLPPLVYNLKAEITDFAVDMETFDTAPTAKMISLALVGYNRFSCEVAEEIYARFDVKLMPGTVSRSTIQWWKKQDAINPGLLAEATNGTTDPLEFFDDFTRGYPKGAKVWGNGATFDVTILEETLKSLNCPVPWPFWDVRDLRTLLDVADVNARQCHFDGDKHNALHDARHQAKMAMYAKRKIREALDADRG
jgi:exodeoxyribonuclease VIII